MSQVPGQVQIRVQVQVFELQVHSSTSTSTRNLKWHRYYILLHILPNQLSPRPQKSRLIRDSRSTMSSLMTNTTWYGGPLHVRNISCDSILSVVTLALSVRSQWCRPCWRRVRQQQWKQVHLTRAVLVRTACPVQCRFLPRMSYNRHRCQLVLYPGIYSHRTRRAVSK